MLTGKSAVGTGSSRGIGRASALELAAQGTHVVVNYAGNENKAQVVVDEIKQMGVKSFKYKANVADEKSVKDMVKQVVDEFGSLDILVNNAGITRDNLLMRMKEDEFDQVIDTNLKGVYVCMKAVSRQMMRQRRSEERRVGKEERAGV